MGFIKVFLTSLKKFASFLFKKDITKWGFLSFLWYGATVLFDLLLDLLPGWFGQDISSLFSSFSPMTWYFIDYFNLGTGLAIILSASAIRMLLTMVPVIGPK